MPPSGLKPAVPAIEMFQTYALDRRATGIGYYYYYYYYYLLLFSLPRTELDNCTFIFMGVGVKRKAFSTPVHGLTSGTVFATDPYIPNKVKS